MTDAWHDLRLLAPSGDPSAVAGLLPPGRLVSPGNEAEAAPVLWMSEGEAPVGLWEELHRAHPATGLWPLLLVPLRAEAPFRPWETGELDTRSASEPDWYDPAALLRTGWQYCVALDQDGEPLDPEELTELGRSIVPFTGGWPGTAPAAAYSGDPDEAARALAKHLVALGGPLRPRIGLVAAGSGAEALTVMGWTGPVNHEDDVAKVSAVLLDWERRYGARVVQVGFAELEVSVAAPPADLDSALHVAAEHLAFCPDNIFQGAGTLAEYAPDLIGSGHWYFWWD
ncbi:DUF4253 domain-containing protein [Streptomyces sp. TLI_171]|uniref:DUF4253 domain-containing protein n=1 Tax=Streptomyces sp. TLI_171 TaxID=1938859 RepID=UPI000C1822B7|nr:DUF4253 domain-containing protein [Streptomyces sp. TLI_171]RKE23251.1 uncharacterized protein DUF4253 [Streptomyces sp. TLI_171]